MTDKLTVYSQPGCRPCKAAIDRLKADGVPFNVVDISVDEEGHERVKRAGYTQTPVFRWHGEFHTIASLPMIRQQAKASSFAAGTME